MKSLLTLCLLLAAPVSHAQFDAIRTLTPEQGQEVRRPIEAKIFNSTLAELPAMESELLAVFQDPKTTLEGKQYVCRMLRFCGSDACVPVLEKELLNPKLSHFVRLAFQGLKGDAADTALLAALPQADEEIQIGIIGTLGRRETKKAVSAIAPFLEGEQADLERAAITALGNIGGKKAEKALAKHTVKPELYNAWEHARIKASAGVTAYPFGLFSSHSGFHVCKALLSDKDVGVRCAALVGLAKANPEKASAAVLDALESDQLRVRNTAITLLPDVPAKQLIAGRPGMTAENRVRLINELAGRGASAAEDMLILAMDNENEAIRTAAIRALGKVGGAKSIPLLIASAPVDKTAFQALSELDAKGTDEAIIQAMERAGDDKMKVDYIKCLSARRTPAALPALFKLASGDWNRSCAAAIDGMARLVSEDDYKDYMDLMIATDNTKKIKAIEKSMTQAARYQRNPGVCSSIMAASFPETKGEVKYATIRALGSIGGPAADTILSEAKASADPKTKDAAIRGLCASPNPAVADELLKLAENSDNTTYQVLALRGYIRLAAEQEAETRLKMCQQAATLTDRPAELKSIIACAKTVHKPASVALIASMIEKPDMLNDCGWAIVELSWNWTTRADTLEPLKKIEALSQDKNLKFYVGDRIKDIESKH